MISRGLLAILVAASTLAQAQQYKWVDERGRVQFGDVPPPAAKKVEKITSDAPPAPSAPGAAIVPYELQRAQKDFPVTLYTSPGCKAACEMARDALNKRGVPFTEVQVWNPETTDKLRAATGADNVPALVVGRSVQSGFEQSLYDALLDSAGYPKQGVLPVRSQGAPTPPEGYQAARGTPPPEPAKQEPAPKAGPYDTSGLPANRVEKPGQYDPSGLKGTPPKEGPYLKPEPEK